MGNARLESVATADDVTRSRYFDLLRAEEQTGSPVPVDEFTFSAASADNSVVGENRSGVRSAEKQMLADYAPSNKVDSARRCGLILVRKNSQYLMRINSGANTASMASTVKTLPGVTR